MYKTRKNTKSYLRASSFVHFEKLPNLVRLRKNWKYVVFDLFLKIAESSEFIFSKLFVRHSSGVGENVRMKKAIKLWIFIVLNKMALEI